VGVVKFTGEALPKKRAVNMGADPACANQHATPVYDQTLMINADKSIQNVLVYVKSGLAADAPKTEAPAGANLDQHGCEYVPHVIAVEAGQSLTVWNGDPLLHNVKYESKLNGNQNLGMPIKGMKMVLKPGKPEFGATFRCDVHPWMSAVLHVMPNAYFFVSDVQGRFEIKGLPPGTYEIGTWHERDGKGVKTKTSTVTIAADKSTRMDIELSDK
jgi:hypothetical protein